MIDTKDLMIGDYVLLNGTPYKVSTIKKDNYGKLEDDGVEVSLTSDSTDFWQPIPVTPELLLKNGFTVMSIIYKYPYRHHLRYDDGGTSVDVRFWAIDSKPIIEIDSENYYIQNLEFEYLHELQHIFKLCKIEKEWLLQINQLLTIKTKQYESNSKPYRKESNHPLLRGRRVLRHTQRGRANRGQMDCRTP